MARSTIDVLWVLEDTNRLLDLPTVPVGVKQGAAVLLERVLFQTGNYAGFMYLNLSDTHHPCKEGAVWTDEDRAARVYLYSRRMKKQADRLAAAAKA